MSIALALLIVAVAYAALRLAQDYIRRSLRSFNKAERVWQDVRRSADAVLAEPVPEALARTVLLLVKAAGCGCFVRGFVMNRYLPRLRKLPESGTNVIGKAFEEIEAGDRRLRDKFSELLAAVIIYDSFRNPVSGWLFRRMLSNKLNPRTSPVAKMEAMLMAFAVLSRKLAH